MSNAKSLRGLYNRKVRFPLLLGSYLGLCTALGLADVRGCVCDLTNVESMQARECGLCRLAEQQTGEGDARMAHTPDYTSFTWSMV